MPHSKEVVPVYVPIRLWHRRYGGRYVEVLQAVCGNGYRVSFFDAGVVDLAPPECFTTDDLWISGYLKFSKNVSRALMKEDIQPVHTTWKKKNVKGKWDLSSINGPNHFDIKCIRAIERVFNVKWF